MKSLWFVVTTLLLAVLTTESASATRDVDSVEVRFQLTLHGDVPRSDTFYLTFTACRPGDPCTGEIGIAVFCGTGQDPHFATPGPCKGGGTT